MLRVCAHVINVSLAVSLAGCTAISVDTPFEMLDSAGVEIVVSHGPSWTPEQHWKLGPSPILEIGVEEGESEFLFSRVVGAIRLPSGEIVVGDGTSNQLRFFDSTGSFVRSVGREGGGPGEFEYLRALRRCEPDAIFAFDLSWQRSRFDLRGEFVDRLTLFAEDNRTPYHLSCNANGEFLVTGWRALTLVPTEGFFRTTVPLVLLDQHGNVMRDLGTVPGSERIGSRSGSRPHPFGKSTVSALSDGTIYLGTADTYEIRVLGFDGTLRRLLRRDDVDLQLLPTHVDEYRDNRLAVAPPDRHPMIERQISGWEFPPTKPAYVRIELDPAGNLWVQGFEVPLSVRQVWSVFASDGRLLGDVEMPARFEVSEIGLDYLLGVFKNDLDVESVRLYGLHKPPVDP